MRKSVAIVLMMVLAAAGAPSAVLAAGQATGALTGTVRGDRLQPLTGVRIQLRDVQSGDLIAETTATETGSFSFAELPAGTYVAEAVDATGHILGVGAPVSLGVAGSATTSVIASGVGTAAASTGFHLLGMGPITSLTVLGAAAAASVTAVVATRPNASPSR
jgi:carboxypeptidase family protein